MKHGARIAGLSGALWLALGAAGCATTPAPPSGTVTSPIPGHAPESVHSADTSTGAIPTPPPVPPPMQVGTTASGGAIVQTGSPSDSGPSADARAVLSTIPDPVPGSETGTAAPTPAGNAGASGSAGAAGTAGATGALVAARPDSAGADTSIVAADSGSVPTPRPPSRWEHPGVRCHRHHRRSDRRARRPRRRRRPRGNTRSNSGGAACACGWPRCRSRRAPSARAAQSQP